MERTSRLSGFYKLKPEERLRVVAEFADLTDEEAQLLCRTGTLTLDQADRMIENVVGVFPVPLGVAVNFTINGRDYLVPMATEEPSVVAACSNAARLARIKGGFWTTSTGPLMRAQIQAIRVIDPAAAAARLYEHREELLELANSQDPMLVRLGGGAREIEVHLVHGPLGPMVVVHLIVDTRDAMGANAVNTMAEALAPLVERITGGRVILRILSNLADRRLVRARTVVDREALGGNEVVEAILWAYSLAAVDPYRAATHNKGIMNGITAVVLATGNDTRAVEAGAHAYAARSGRYTTLTVWEQDADGNLVGSIEVPMAVGLVGGATKAHPVARLAVKILGVQSATELAEVIGAVGLAQNLAALRALATEGIQRGHMELHARNVAVAAGAVGEEVDRIAAAMVREKQVRLDRALALLQELRGKGGDN